MVTTLLLSLATSHTPSVGIHLGADASLRSARLIAQAPPPLPVRPAEAPVAVGGREAQLQSDIEAINGQLRTLKTDWPTVSVVLAYAGFSSSPLVLVGLLIFGLGAASGIGIITIIGAAFLVVGVVGIVLGVVGVVTGLSASNSAKAKRDELLRERGVLEGELKALKAQPGSVDRSFESSPRLITVAAF